jgi:hypothetical protein
MNNVRVTYYLGAGASANAIPMVSQIRYYYKPFLEFIKNKIGRNTWPDGGSSILKQFGIITEELEKHYTPDTYAKKLWLQEEYLNLGALKFYLSLFFYWIENKYFPSDMDSISMVFKPVFGRVDERYDPFLATLLERIQYNNLRFPSNINIVTWNYDAQLETAYSNFVKRADDNIIRNGLCVFPKPPNQGYSPSMSRIVKLNGCSRLFFSNERSEVISPFDHPNSEKIPIDLLKEFDRIIGSLKTDLSRPLINFAWETDNPVSQESLKEAKDIFSKTQILVIIGYSFPTFNRKVDKDLFEHLPENCTVYYQAPELVVHDLIDKLKSIKHLTNPVKPVFNLDQFHIPIEL